MNVRAIKNKILLIVLAILSLLFFIIYEYSNDNSDERVEFSDYIGNVSAGTDGNYRIVYKDLIGFSSEGSQGALWYFDNKLVKMEISHYASMGKRTEIYDFYVNYVAVSIIEMYYKEPFDADNIDYFKNEVYILANESLYSVNNGLEEEILCNEEEKDKMIQSLLNYGEALNIELSLE